MDGPTFPKERPAIQFIVSQVSKIEGALACSKGYYNTLGKVLSRIDKTDIALNQLNQLLKENNKTINETNSVILKKAEHADIILNQTMDIISLNLRVLRKENTERISEMNSVILRNVEKTLNEIKQKNNSTNAILLSKSIPPSTPLWKLTFYSIFFLAVGIFLGKVL